MACTSLILVAALLASGVQPAPFSAASYDIPNGLIRLPVRSRGFSSDVERRQLPVTLKNTLIQYVLDVEIGTPAQPVSLSIDTGSSDIWVYGPGSCSVCEGGIFDPSQSSSLVEQTSLGNFEITYFDNTHVQGYYVSDTVAVGGATVTGATLAVASTTPDKHTGIMGIGLDGLESDGGQYYGFIDDLYNQGLINSHSFSIYLDDIGASTGEIILGGYDSSKWSGTLATLPIIPYVDNVPRLQIEWTSLSVTDASGATSDLTNSDVPYPVVLDTGYTTTVLPVDLFNYFYNFFGASTDQYGNYLVPCDLGSGYVNFGFGDGPAVVISVPFSELAVYDSSAGVCLFGFQPAGDRVISFGDTFIRSAYVFYDYDAMTIGLAKAIWT